MEQTRFHAWYNLYHDWEHEPNGSEKEPTTWLYPELGSPPKLIIEADKQAPQLLAGNAAAYRGHLRTLDLARIVEQGGVENTPLEDDPDSIDDFVYTLI